MKNIVKGLLVSIIALGLLMGCSGTVKEKNVESFITKLVTSDTYENIGTVEEGVNFIEGCKKKFGDDLTSEAFDSLMANRTFTVYKDVLSKSKGATDIKVIKTSETENKGYIHMEYEVSYKLEYSDRTVDMTDYMVFNVIDEKGYIIDKASVLDKKSSVFKEYKTIAR